MPLSVDAGQNLGTLRAECKRLRKHYATISSDMVDYELKEAKRLAKDGEEAVARTKELWRIKVRSAAEEHESARSEDRERIARYETKHRAMLQRISALEAEIGALRASAPKQQPNAAAAEGGSQGRSEGLGKRLQDEMARQAADAAEEEPLAAFLGRLQLSHRLAALEEEELDVGLLRSMGQVDLAFNMDQLGLAPAERARMIEELFKS